MACIVTVGKSARFVTAVNSFTSILDKVLAPYVDHTAKVSKRCSITTTVSDMCSTVVGKLMFVCLLCLYC